MLAQRPPCRDRCINPQVGFTLLGNTAHPSKYPYNPYYGEWSPRVAGAWDVYGDGRTVIRGGYGLTYGRLNGVDLVLVPLLGTGLIQAVQCTDRTWRTVPAEVHKLARTTVFRVADGWPGSAAREPLVRPCLNRYYPGVNGVAAGAGEALDPNFRPNKVHTFTLTFARQLNNNMSLEIGYIGRIIKNEYMGMNLNAVPYMMTKGGQTFANAYANAVIGYCGSGNVNELWAEAMHRQHQQRSHPSRSLKLRWPVPATATALPTAPRPSSTRKESVQTAPAISAIQNVWSLYSDLDNGGFNFPRSMMNTSVARRDIGGSGQLTSGVGMNASIGYGNYNALFVTLKTQAWKGVSMQSNFTWSKALGTGAAVQATSAATAPDPFNLRTGYGLRRSIVRSSTTCSSFTNPTSTSRSRALWATCWEVGRSLRSSPLVAVCRSRWHRTINGGGQAFGEGDSVNFLGYGNSENAIPMTPWMWQRFRPLQHSRVERDWHGRLRSQHVRESGSSV